MSIIASAPVPTRCRLIDADTIDLSQLRRDAELVEIAARTNPSGVRLLADAIRARELGERPAECPPWCSEDHRGQLTEVNGFSIGLCHEQMLAEVTAQDPSWHREHAATVRVFVESTTEAGLLITPTRVVLAVAEGEQGQYPGSADTQGWTGSAEQARALAAALLAAADLLDGGAR